MWYSITIEGHALLDKLEMHTIKILVEYTHTPSHVFKSKIQESFGSIALFNSNQNQFKSISFRMKIITENSIGNLQQAQ